VSITEAYNLPIGLRSWFIEQLNEQFEREKEAHEKAKRKS
jgi:hypothetical protein